MPENPLVSDDVIVGLDDYASKYTGPYIEGDGPRGWLDGLPPVEIGASLAESYESLDWQATLYNAKVAHLEAVGAIIDPFGTLAGYGVAWLMEHLAPLRFLLDGLCGNPAKITAYAEGWLAVSEHLARTEAEFRGTAEQGAHGWCGPAADAHRYIGEGIADLMTNCVAVTATLGKMHEAAGLAVAAVRTTVRDLIAMIVGEAIVVLIEEAATLGAATPYAMHQLLTLINRCIFRAMTEYELLLEVMKAFIAIFKTGLQLVTAMNEAMDALKGPQAGS